MGADATVTPSQPPAPSWQDARWTFRLPVVAVCLFAAIGGFVDGFTVLRFDTFAANHSANVVRIGMGIVGQYDGWPKSAAALVGFVVGIVVATFLGRRARAGDVAPPVRTVLFAAAALLVFGLFAALLGPDQPMPVQCALLLVCSAGVGGLAVVFVRTDGVPSATMYQTGTVVQASRGLLDWVTSGPAGRRASGHLVAIGGVTLLAYGAGGAVGALASAWTGWLVLIGPAAVLASLLLLRRFRVPAAPMTTAVVAADAGAAAADAPKAGEDAPDA